jgi:uncharacterized membrane protein
MQKNKINILRKTLQEWKEEGLLSEDLFQKLSESPALQEKSFPWARLAILSFVFSIGSFAIVFCELDIARYIIEYFTEFSLTTRCCMFGLFSLILYGAGLGFVPVKFISKCSFFGELLTILGAVFTALCLCVLSKICPLQRGQLIGIATVVYGIVGYAGRSKMLWSLALIALGYWLDATEICLAGFSLDLLKPIKFVCMGLLLIFWSFSFKSDNRLRTFMDQTLFFGLLYLFTALWILSIPDTFLSHTPSDNLLCFSIASGAAAFLAICIGLKYDIPLVQNFGSVFFAINLITKYFEHFWNSCHKSLFFFVLGFIFFIIAVTAKSGIKIPLKFIKYLKKTK